MSQEGLEENYGGLEKNSQQEGGLPKLFCLMRRALKKINLFHQIILVKETNIVEYLVLVWTQTIQSVKYKIRIYMTGDTS